MSETQQRYTKEAALSEVEELVEICQDRVKTMKLGLSKSYPRVKTNVTITFLEMAWLFNGIFNRASSAQGRCSKQAVEQENAKDSW